MINIEHYIKLWQLLPDGNLIETKTSRLLPVIYNNQTAMLKIALVSEELIGNQLMVYWNGHGCARVMVKDANAIVMERAQGKQSLLHLASLGSDDLATEIICDVVKTLHSAPITIPLPNVNLAATPLAKYFKSLSLAAKARKGIFISAEKIALELLDDQKEVMLLHGDIHHENILDFGRRGWLAIDPKGLHGDRAFDYANLFCNPQAIAGDSERFKRQLDMVCKLSGIEKSRLLKWIFAYAGLSASWHYEDGTNPDCSLKIAALAFDYIK